MRAAVIGAGGWGTALAVSLAGKGAQVNLWVRNSALYKTIVLKRVNETYLPGVKLPPAVRPTLELAEALQDRDLVILSVPSHGVRATAMAIRGLLPPDSVLVCAAKGLEENSYLRMSQVLAQELGSPFSQRIAVISGPNHAEEVSRDPHRHGGRFNQPRRGLLVQEALTARLSAFIPTRT